MLINIVLYNYLLLLLVMETLVTLMVSFILNLLYMFE